MMLTNVLLLMFVLIARLAFAGHVISNKNLDCRENNGQIIRMDWTACSHPKYEKLTINLAAYKDTPPHYYVRRNGNEKVASICVKDQFAEFDLFLDNGTFSYNQQRIYISTEQDQAIMRIFSHSFNKDGSIHARVPIFVPIRNAQFSSGGRGAAKQTILKSSSDDNDYALNLRPPNQAINVMYC